MMNGIKKTTKAISMIITTIFAILASLVCLFFGAVGVLFGFKAAALFIALGVMIWFAMFCAMFILATD